MTMALFPGDFHVGMLPLHRVNCRTIILYYKVLRQTKYNNFKKKDKWIVTSL
jgi:hypothetical protein